MIAITCKQCNKETEVRQKRGGFCSQACYWDSMRGAEVPEDRRQKISSTMKDLGISPVVKWKKGCESPYLATGEKSGNWRGGISKDPHYGSLMAHKRRVREIEAGGSYTIGEWETLKAQYNWTCPCCKRTEDEAPLTVDHIIPISRGGSNNIENIQPLCKSCNSRKRTKVIKYEL